VILIEALLIILRQLWNQYAISRDCREESLALEFAHHQSDSTLFSAMESWTVRCEFLFFQKMHEARIWQFARNSRPRDFFFLAMGIVVLSRGFCSVSSNDTCEQLLSTTLDTAGYPHVGHKREIYYWRIRVQQPSETCALLPSLTWRETNKRCSYIL